MNLQRIAGPALIVVGVILTVIGINASHSFSDQMSDLFRGKFTDSTNWYILGGAAVAVVGLVCTVATLRRQPA
jgi:drug/metabolite transporter (DMT)-like permease